MRDDYYELLGLTPDASKSAISKAYRQLSLQLHPDKNPVGEWGGEESWYAEALANVREAYEVLKDPVKRYKYDERARWIRQHPEQVKSSSSEAPRRHSFSPGSTATSGFGFSPDSTARSGFWASSPTQSFPASPQTSQTAWRSRSKGAVVLGHQGKAANVAAFKNTSWSSPLGCSTVILGDDFGPMEAEPSFPASASASQTDWRRSTICEATPTTSQTGWRPQKSAKGQASQQMSGDTRKFLVKTKDPGAFWVQPAVALGPIKGQQPQASNPLDGDHVARRLEAFLEAQTPGRSVAAMEADLSDCGPAEATLAQRALTPPRASVMHQKMSASHGSFFQADRADREGLSRPAARASATQMASAKVMQRRMSASESGFFQADSHGSSNSAAPKARASRPCFKPRPGLAKGGPVRGRPLQFAREPQLLTTKGPLPCLQGRTLAG